MQCRNLHYLAAAALLIAPHTLHAADPSWQPDGVPVCVAGGSQDRPAIVADGAGGAFVVFADNRSGAGFDIYAQHVDAFGNSTWALDGVPVCTAPYDQLEVRAIADGAGGIILCWRDFRPIMASDVYAQRLDAAGTAMWTDNGVPVCTAISTQTDARLVSDGARGAIIVWNDWRLATPDIYAQRVTATGVLLGPTNGTPVCDANNYQVLPAVSIESPIVSDGAGGAIVAWQDFRNGVSYDIYAQRIDGNGAGLWGTNGVAACIAPYDQVSVILAADGQGGTILAWNDFRDVTDPAWDIYAQRLDSGGVPRWDAAGVSVTVAQKSQRVSSIITAPSGGVFLAWYDAQGTDNDIYAELMTLSGTMAWSSSGGVRVCAAVGEQTAPVLAADRDGGVYVAWQDGRDAGDDIYAQRVAADGTPVWDNDGVAMSAAAGVQSRVQIAGDGSGGMIVAFQDARGTDNDIYAQRMESPPSGVLPSAALALRANAPNPFRGGTDLQVGLPRDSDVRVEVYTVTGRRVRTLATPVLSAGWQRIAFDGRDDDGRALASGVYFYRVSAGGETTTMKMVIAR